MAGRPTDTADRPTTPGGGGGVGTSPAAASTLASTLNESTPYAFSPTLSISAGTVGGTWSTVITRASDAGAVTVTGSTTTTPTATLTAATPANGDAFACTSTYTDPDGLTDAVETTVRMSGTSAARVVLAADPADQVKASGTTSSTAATFTSPTGGSGAFSPVVTLEQVRGSGAALAGSGAGPITVNSLEDNDIARVVCTWTDDAGVSQQSVNTYDVAVKAQAQDPTGGTGTAVRQQLLAHYDLTAYAGSAQDFIALGDGAQTIAGVELIGGGDLDFSTSATANATTYGITNDAAGLVYVSNSDAAPPNFYIDIKNELAASGDDFVEVIAVFAVVDLPTNKILTLYSKKATGGNNGDARTDIRYTGSHTEIRVARRGSSNWSNGSYATLEAGAESTQIRVSLSGYDDAFFARADTGAGLDAPNRLTLSKRGRLRTLNSAASSHTTNHYDAGRVMQIQGQTGVSVRLIRVLVYGGTV